MANDSNILLYPATAIRAKQHRPQVPFSARRICVSRQANPHAGRRWRPSTPSSGNCRPLRLPSFAGSSASGNTDWKDWTRIIPARKPRFGLPLCVPASCPPREKKPRDGSTHWSCRKLASALGISKDAVHRVWQEAGLKPHRLERYLAQRRS